MNALERRLELWERDEITSLLLEAVTIQKKLTLNNDPKKIADILKEFAKLMGKTNINGLLNLFKNGVLPLGKKTLNSKRHSTRHSTRIQVCDKSVLEKCFVE